MLDELSISLNPQKTFMKIHNETPYDLKIYIKPIPPKRRLELVKIVKKKSMLIIDIFLHMDLDINRLLFNLIEENHGKI